MVGAGARRRQAPRCLSHRRLARFQGRRDSASMLWRSQPPRTCASVKAAAVLFSLLVARCASGLFTCTVQDDICAALGDLYAATNGPGWVNNTGWADAASGVPADYCTFYGITPSVDYNDLPSDYGSAPSGCSPGSIDGLLLAKNNLVGTLPDSLGSLTTISVLLLNYNQLSGTLPATLGRLTSLTHFNIVVNMLSGTVPDSLGNLVNVVNFQLSGNALSGTIPATFDNFAQVTYLSISTNALSGSIPPLCNLNNIGFLDFSRNSLTGTVPDCWGNLVTFWQLDLFTNSLSGTLPASFANLQQMETVRIYLNNFTGTIPDAYGQLVQLGLVDFHSNSLSGTIPASFGNLVNLNTLNLASNQLSGSIPTTLGSLTSLAVLDLHNNLLSGTLPQNIRDMSVNSGVVRHTPCMISPPRWRTCAPGAMCPGLTYSLRYRFAAALLVAATAVTTSQPKPTDWHIAFT